MNYIKKTMMCALLAISFSTSLLAGKWVNWDVIVEDIQDSITSVVDFFRGDEVNSEKTQKTKHKKAKKDKSHKKTKMVASGTIISKEISLEKVNVIDATRTGTLLITQDDTQEGMLVIEADQILMPYLQAKVVDNKLIIKTQKNIPYNIEAEDAVYHVKIKNVTNIMLSGAVQAELNGIKTKSLSLDITGASRLSGDINVENMIIESSGASKITLSGKADTQNFDVGGSCKIDCRDLIGRTIAVDVWGASTVFCNASDSLSGDVSGVSSLFYANKPVVSVESSAMASVHKL